MSSIRPEWHVPRVLNKWRRGPLALRVLWRRDLQVYICAFQGFQKCFSNDSVNQNGSYVSGAPACPPSAQDSSGVSGNLNASASALTGFSTPSGSASLPAVSATSEKKRPSAGLVAGIVIMSAALLIILSLALLFQRRSKHRRAAERHAIQIKRQTDTISPFTLINQIGGPDSRGIDAKKERLRTELSVMQEKMVNLEDLERRTTSGSNAPRILRLQLGRSTRAGSRQGTSRDAAAVQDLEGKLQACKQHIDTLVNRINELETNADFAWGMGVSGEPPPDYV
ncbi:hypothetical protein B0H19DRAFT_529292 [Mycena capillaripes]|nr:hypothetical protein B0H19DRAFT_529292 [Mycena capillaripes]